MNKLLFCLILLISCSASAQKISSINNLTHLAKAPVVLTSDSLLSDSPFSSLTAQYLMNIDPVYVAKSSPYSDNMPVYTAPQNLSFNMPVCDRGSEFDSNMPVVDRSHKGIITKPEPLFPKTP